MKTLIFSTLLFIGFAVGGLVTNVLDQGQLQRRYDEGYQAGHTRGIDSWPELRKEFRQTGVCDWARMMVISKTCTTENK